jgi:hypothetical protein
MEALQRYEVASYPARTIRFLRQYQRLLSVTSSPSRQGSTEFWPGRQRNWGV